ncbi:chaperone protein ClpB3, chloroplastic-like protein [Tanacetum coccineum]
MMPLISSLPPFMVCGDVDRQNAGTHSSRNAFGSFSGNVGIQRPGSPKNLQEQQFGSHLGVTDRGVFVMMAMIVSFDSRLVLKLKVNLLHIRVLCGVTSNFNTSGVAVEGMGRVGDGTTDVVLLAVEFSIEANPFIKNGVINKIKELVASIKGKTLVEKSNASNMETERCQPKRSHMGDLSEYEVIRIVPDLVSDSKLLQQVDADPSLIGMSAKVVLDCMISLTLDADTLQFRRRQKAGQSWRSHQRYIMLKTRNKTKAAGTPFYHDSLNKLKNATDYQKVHTALRGFIVIQNSVSVIFPHEITEMAWQSIVSSLEVAKVNKHQIVETEHLLKGMLEEKNGLAQGIFSKADVD